SPANAFASVKVISTPAAGTLADNGVPVAANDVVPVADITANKLVFTPVANANGSPYASFKFRVSDDGGTANGGVDTSTSDNTITVDVTSVNDAPTGADKTVTTNEDTPYTFGTGDFGFADAADSPANAFASVKVISTPAAGTLASYPARLSSDLVVPVADITANKLVFTPVANANGSRYAAFKFRVSDDG